MKASLWTAAEACFRRYLNNAEYKAQRALLGKVDAAEIPLDDFPSCSEELFEQELAGPEKLAESQAAPVATRG